MGIGDDLLRVSVHSPRLSVLQLSCLNRVVLGNFSNIGLLNEQKQYTRIIVFPLFSAGVLLIHGKSVKTCHNNLRVQLLL